MLAPKYQSLNCYAIMLSSHKHFLHSSNYLWHCLVTLLLNSSLLRLGGRFRPLFNNCQATELMLPHVMALVQKCSLSWIPPFSWMLLQTSGTDLVNFSMWYLWDFHLWLSWFQRWKSSQFVTQWWAPSWQFSIPNSCCRFKNKNFNSWGACVWHSRWCHHLHCQRLFLEHWF